MLACSKAILSALKNYIEIDSLKTLEKSNYYLVSQMIENYNISYNLIKNNAFFNKINQNAAIKRIFLNKKDELYKEILKHISAICNFCKSVKSVYKYGIEINGGYNDILKSLFVAPYIYRGNEVTNLMAGSGVMNLIGL